MTIARLILEDSSGFLQLEDGSGVLLLEDSSGPTPPPPTPSTTGSGGGRYFGQEDYRCERRLEKKIIRLVQRREALQERIQYGASREDLQKLVQLVTAVQAELDRLVAEFAKSCEEFGRLSELLRVKRLVEAEDDEFGEVLHLIMEMM